MKEEANLFIKQKRYNNILDWYIESYNHSSLTKWLKLCYNWWEQRRCFCVLYLSYRVLLPHNYFCQNICHCFVLLLEKDAPSLRKIKQQVKYIKFKSICWLQHGNKVYQFNVELIAFKHIYAIHDSLPGAIICFNFCCFYNNGGGITLIRTHIDCVRSNICMKNIWELKIRVYKQIAESFTHPNYFWFSGHLQDSHKYGLLYHIVLNMVDGDKEKNYVLSIRTPKKRTKYIWWWKFYFQSEN